MRKLKNLVESLSVGYSISDQSKVYADSQTISMHEIQSATINSIQYFSNILAKSLIQGVDNIDRLSSDSLKTTFLIKYVGGSFYEGEISIPFEQILSLAMWHRDEIPLDEKEQHLNLVLKGCFENVFNEIETNFNEQYGIYIPIVHLKPLKNTCINCEVSFDGGSIFENFVKQGKEKGVELYQTHHNEILKIVESSYGEPYRFGENICYYKTQMEVPKRRWYECTKCKTEQPFIQHT